MPLTRIIVISLSILVWASSNASAQKLDDEAIAEKLEIYSKANPANILFIHTDKTTYTNNETIWFSGYLIKKSEDEKIKHTILSIAFVREDDREIVLQERYVMQEGLGFGSLLLPDSIPPGNYQFLASTNVLDKNNKPLAVFAQSITVKSIIQTDFNVALTLLDTTVVNDAVRVQLAVEPKSNSKIKPVAGYIAGSISKKNILLKDNNVIITIPAAELNREQPVLLTTVKYGLGLQHLSLRLPELKSETINIRFFPEGGNLIDGIESIVAWEAKTSRGLAVPVTAMLYQNDKLIGPVSTNSYGIGRLKLTPDKKSTYSLKISANKYLKADKTFTLPQPEEGGVVFHLTNTIVSDTVRISLFSKKTTPVKVIVHNYNRVFAMFNVLATARGNRISIVLPVVPKGISTITVLDAEDRPVAERLFFAHYEQKIKGDIEFNKPVYNRKDSVRVIINMTDNAGKPINGIVSIAAVQDNRIERIKQQDIESYYYLNYGLGSLPQDPQGRGLNNRDYLEDILLVKGWRRYTWKDMINTNAQDSVQTLQTPVFKGLVTSFDRDLKKPVEMYIFRDSLLSPVTTNINGSFTLSLQDMVITEGRTMFMSTNNSSRDGYKVTVTDPFEPINKQLADQATIPVMAIAQRVESNGMQLADMNNSINLQEVVIKANRNDNSLYPSGSNACGDYVCVNEILNCINHVAAQGNHPPQEGENYKVRAGIEDTNLSRIVYSGCVGIKSQGVFKIKGIYMAREFYGVDMSTIGRNEAQYLSTLFWKPGVIVADGKADISFYTGSIAGKFRIVIQGVGEKDMIFSEAAFSVN